MKWLLAVILVIAVGCGGDDSKLKTIGFKLFFDEPQLLSDSVELRVKKSLDGKCRIHSVGESNPEKTEWLIILYPCNELSSEDVVRKLKLIEHVRDVRL